MTSGSQRSEPPRYRRLWQFAVVLLVLSVVFVVFAWRQGDDSGGGGPLNAIAEAAEKTQQEPGGRAVMRSIVTAPERSASFTMTGRMVFDAEGRTEAVITAPQTPAGGSLTVHSVTDGTVMYVRSSQFGSLPDGAEWMAFDLALGDDLEAPVPANADAKGELALLEAVGDDVQKLGKEDVNGVPTTHYRGVLSTADQVERLREEGADDLASVADEEGAPFHVEAWIDADGLVRRMRLVHSQPSEKADGPTTIDMRMDFFDFGTEPEIDVPDSGEVFDATELARSKLGLPSDS